MVNELFNSINSFLAKIIFYDVLPGEGTMPFIVAWLVFGAIFITFRMGFINLKLLKHGLSIILGKYRTKDDKGEISSFQALTTALSATVGLGNLGGVAIAVSIGGPGATFWMIFAAFFGMSAKFTEVTLAQHYRKFSAGKKIMGGPMEYLSKGFAEKGLTGLGKGLAVFFAIGIILSSLGGGNAFQVSQALGAAQQEFAFFKSYPLAFGFIMVLIVGLVIIGGIKNIAKVTERIVPLMLILYIVVTLWIILTNIAVVPDAIKAIVVEAFAPVSVVGGVVGSIIVGFQRSAFSNEAGLGSASIAHSTASVKYPIRQGIVALYEPFIDTIVICSLTALVIIITGVYNAPEFADLVANKNGAALTIEAFRSQVSWFPSVLSIIITLFAYSTMISWSYYGERCWSYLFGEKTAIIYKVCFLFFILLSTIASSSVLLDFADLTFLVIAIPNLIGLYFLHGKVKELLKEYRIKLKDGSFDKESV
ncbi:Na(+)-linked D-alanine glycine permease [hydrothermal vent metagenome]|uniref:Na(+)-linked D-alanine glycine permease n=1 Tax=hydrothermal vent metagenome TaxID=652676 RepID=A0A1W1CGV6_9ZZZZ